MTKSDVIDLLEKNKGKWFKTKDIARLVDSNSASNNLTSMWASCERTMHNLERRKKEGTMIWEWRVK